MDINENSIKLEKILKSTKRKQNCIFQITQDEYNESYIKNVKNISQCTLHKKKIIKLTETVNCKMTVMEEKCYPEEKFEFGKICEIERKFIAKRYQEKFNVQSNIPPPIMENNNKDVVPLVNNYKVSQSNSHTIKGKFSHSLDVGLSKVSKIKEIVFSPFILTQFFKPNPKFENIKEKNKAHKIEKKYKTKQNLDRTEIFTFKTNGSITKLQSTKHKECLSDGEILKKDIIRNFISEKNNIKILHRCKEMKHFKQDQSISICTSRSIINKPLLSKSDQNKLENESRHFLLLPNKKIKPRNVISLFLLKKSSSILANKPIFEINIENSDNDLKHLVNSKKKSDSSIFKVSNKHLNSEFQNFPLEPNDFLIMKLKRTKSEFFFQIKEFLSEFICNTFYNLQNTLMNIHQKLQEAKKKFRILITIKKITVQTEKYLKEFSSFQEENLLIKVNKYFFQYFVENQKHTLKLELNEKFEVILNFIIDFQKKIVVTDIPVDTDIKKLSIKFSNLIHSISQKKAHSLNYKFFKDILKLNYYYTNQNNQLNELYFNNLFSVDIRTGKFFEKCHYIHLKIQSIVDSKCGKHFKPKIIIKELKINFKEYKKKQQKLMMENKRML